MAMVPSTPVALLLLVPSTLVALLVGPSLEVTLGTEWWVMGSKAT